MLTTFDYVSARLDIRFKKKHGSLLANAIWNRVGEPLIPFRTDQFLLTESGYQLVDLYFPSLRYGVMLLDEDYVAPTPSVTSSAIAAAALAQVGATQDCTMLVTNALRAVGINFLGWPEDYLSLGTITSSPVAGDIIVYSGHVAIYIGNGQAVHGGWYGSQTVVASVSCDKALIGYVHVG